MIIRGGKYSIEYCNYLYVIEHNGKLYPYLNKSGFWNQPYWDKEISISKFRRIFPFSKIIKEEQVCPTAQTLKIISE